MIIGAIFDVGGVLIRNTSRFVRDEIAKGFHTTLAKAASLIEELQIPLQIGEWTEEEFWQMFSLTMGRPLPKDYKRLWLKGYVKHFSINKEVMALVVAMKKKRYRLGLLTNTIPSHSNYWTSKGVSKCFEHRIISHEVGMRKPELEIFRIALKRMYLDPRECVFIDDDESFVRVAMQQGMWGIHYKNPQQLKEDLTILLGRNSPKDLGRN
jgi:putative hydrolase of the HAD superfamily